MISNLPVAPPLQTVPPLNGRLLAQITDRIVSLVHEHYGHGPVTARTHVLGDLVVCVRSSGLKPLERTMVDGGAPAAVLHMRREFEALMEARYRQVIEELTGRRALAFLSCSHIEPDVTLEAFLMDGPLPGFEAVKLLPAA